MADCDYCEETFGNEEALLEHMRNAHEGELGRIDQRRVGELDGNDGGEFPTGPLALAFIIFASAAVVAFVIFGGGGSSGNSSFGDLPEQGDDQLLSGVQTFESEGRDHVDPGTQVDYAQMPPTSGPHYDSTVSAGFYQESQSLGSLVHSLEHGAVIIYYDPAALDSEAQSNIEEYTSTYTGTFSSVIAVPNPRDDPKSAYVLTAWNHRLRMDQYNEDVVRAFVAEYLGRGPEKKVR